MKISFLVTYYNQARFVKQSLESILALNVPCDYEILVGDDGSTDGTVEEIKKYMTENSNIKLFVMDRDVNVTYDAVLRASAIRLHLLENSKGSYYCILDGDDWYLTKTFVQEALHIMEQDKTLSICAFNFAWVSNDDIKIHSPSIKGGKNSAQEYLLTTYIHAAACVFRNVFDMEKIQFMKELGFFDDQNIMAAHLQDGGMYYIPKVVLAYRQTGSGIWTGMSQYEKHVLDAFEYDIFTKHAHKYEKEIRLRFFTSLKFVWSNRDRFYIELGSKKASNYISLAKKLDGLFYRIINFDKLNTKDRYCVRKILKDTLLHKFIRCAKCMFRLAGKIVKALLPYWLVDLFNKKNKPAIGQ